jgi:hypothetical protein
MEIGETTRRYSSNVERSQLFLCALISRALQHSLLLLRVRYLELPDRFLDRGLLVGRVDKAEELEALADEGDRLRSDERGAMVSGHEDVGHLYQAR